MHEVSSKEETDVVSNRSNRVCPVARAGGLDNRIRRWLQNPQKILRPYIREGMKVLDVGCGPGFFTIGMAQMVGKSGRVIASDLQEGMLKKLEDKIQGTEIEERITLHKCEEDRIGVSEKVDFILLFYMVHEVPNKEAFFREIETILESNGQIFVVEPPFHVSRKAFEDTLNEACTVGLAVVDRPKLFLNKAAVLKKI